MIRPDGERHGAGWESKSALVLRLMPLLAASLFFAFGLWYLYHAHPHEDAFILFKYVENVARGLGVVYYPGGPHAEGAIDFLWLVLLSLMRFAGVDVAVGALVLNAAGAGLTSFLFCEAIRRSSIGPLARIGFGLMTPFVVFLHGTVAGYFGFNPTLYGALTLALCCLCLWATRALPWVPALALVVGLFRSDGVLLGVAFAVVGFLRAYKTAVFRRYVLSSGCVVLLGLAYFLWRWWYFGLLLPLPLYVKGYASSGRGTPVALLRGVYGHLAWFLGEMGTIGFLTAVAVFAVIASRRHARRVLSFAATCLAYLPFVAVLSMAHQSQNIGSRFQAPLFLVACFAVFWLGLLAWDVLRSPLLRVAIVALVIVALYPVSALAIRQFRAYANARLYVDTFAPRFGRLIDSSRTIALTEAGRLSFWTEARVEDVIGLNTPRNALIPPDLDYLREISPDVIVFHEGEMSLEAHLEAETAPVVPISVQLLRDSVPAHFELLFENGLDRYDAEHEPDQVAPTLLVRYLSTREDYSIYAVRYGGQYRHVYAFAAGLAATGDIRNALEETAGHRVPYRPYAAVAGFPFSFTLD